MSSEQPKKSKIDTAQIAMIIFPVVVGIPTLIFFESGDEAFGSQSFLKLLIITAMGGALSSSLCAQTNKRRFLAIPAGILMGIGVPLALLAYVELFKRDSVYKLELFFIACIGMAPGFILRNIMLPNPQEPPSEPPST
jgi:hypothetical protein